MTDEIECEYDVETGWTTPAVRDEIRALLPSFTDAPGAVTGIMAVLNRHGYDSIDREISFSLASHQMGLDYEDFYQAWLNGGSDPTTGKWMASRAPYAWETS